MHGLVVPFFALSGRRVPMSLILREEKRFIALDRKPREELYRVYTTWFRRALQASRTERKRVKETL